MELLMTELPMTELPITEYDGGALSEVEERAREKLYECIYSSFVAYLVCAEAALEHTWHAQQQLWSILGMHSSSSRAYLAMRSSSFCAYIKCAKAADVLTQSTMQPP